MLKYDIKVKIFYYYLIIINKYYLNNIDNNYKKIILMSESNNTSFEAEEEELFEHIDNEDEQKINEFLDGKKQIWKYKSKDNDNSTPLHIAVYKKSYNITKKLIEYCKEYNSEGLKEFIDEKNNQETTAIHFASFKGSVKIIKLLVENGANIYAVTKRKLNIFHYASQGNKPTSLMYFYLNFYVFAKEKDPRIIQLLKDKDAGGSTPLHWAAYSNAEDILLYMIYLKIFENDQEREDFINQKDAQGYTALHLSVSSKSIRIVMKLLQSGANSEIKDKKGNDPLQLAINKKQKEIADVIRNNQNCQMCNMKAPVKQIKKSIKNIILVFSVQALVTFIIFAAVLPIAFRNDNADSNVYYHFIFIIYVFFLALFIMLYLALLIINPGIVQPNNLNRLKDLVDGDIELNKYCYECYREKSKDIKHCIICHKCYYGFDHHCFWINKCVAKNNYCVFLWFLVEAFLYLLIVLLISIFGIIHLIGGNDNNPYIYYFPLFTLRSDFLCDNRIYYYVLNISLILLDLFFIIPETLLLILHLHIYCTNYREKKNKMNTLCLKSGSTTVEAALMKSDENSLDSSGE